MQSEKEKSNQKLKDADIKFIWTVFIICLCYLLCALPGIVLVDIFGMRDGTTFMISLCLLWIQFSLNNFIYAYRSEKYRSAYWDLIVLIFPFLKRSSSTGIQRHETKKSNANVKGKEPDGSQKSTNEENEVCHKNDAIDVLEEELETTTKLEEIDGMGVKELNQDTQITT